MDEINNHVKISPCSEERAGWGGKKLFSFCVKQVSSLLERYEDESEHEFGVCLSASR